MQTKNDNQDFEWLIPSRHKASQFLYEVHKLGEQVSERSSSNHKAAFENLVGVALSLWRAAFLVFEPTKTHRESLEAAREVLIELLKHNRIGYEQEKNNVRWFCRFYLKSAEFRIVRAAELVEIEPGRINELDSVRARVRDQLKAVKVPDRKRWDTAHAAATAIVSEFRAAVRPK